MEILLQELQGLLDNHEHPEEAPKEFHPQGLDYKNDISCTGPLSFQKGRCYDMGQNDTIGKIELKPSIVLSSDNTNCKNDIQLFHQLFDELSVLQRLPLTPPGAMSEAKQWNDTSQFSFSDVDSFSCNCNSIE